MSQVNQNYDLTEQCHGTNGNITTITSTTNDTTSEDSQNETSKMSKTVDAILDEDDEIKHCTRHQVKKRIISSDKCNSSHHYGVKYSIDFKECKESTWSGFWTILNSLALMIALLVQGSILNYFIISFNPGRAEWYFLFFTDFVILVTFMFSITFAWRYYLRNRKKLLKKSDVQSTAITSDHVRFGSGIFRFTFPKPMGMLPLIYICWIIYGINVISKMYIMYAMNIPDSMVSENFTAPKEQILITLAISVAIFLFWIEAHWNLGDERQRHLSKPSVDDLISHTAFELFDSLTFLDLVTPDDLVELQHDNSTISFTMKMTVLTFASVNFILPTLGLYRLSRTHFGEKTYGMIQVIDEETGKPSTRGLGVSIIYHLLRLFAVNIPYMVIRILLSSQNSRKELSIFIVKNILGIVVSSRSLIPELQQWFRITKFKAKLRSQLSTSEDGDESSKDGKIRLKIEPCHNFDPICQGWELPTILETKTVNSSSTHKSCTSEKYTHNKFYNNTALSNESSVDGIEEMDTGTTNSSPSRGLDSSKVTQSNSNEDPIV